MTIFEELKKAKIKIDRIIVSQINLLKEELKKDDLPETETALEMLSAFSVRGKSIRGSLFLLSAEMYGYNKINELLDIAAAIELIHSSLLIHDDVMDDDYLRRGRSTIFAQYEQLAAKYGIKDKKNYGKYAAICVGDIGFYLANQFIVKSKIDNKKKLLMYDYLNLQIMKTGFAQMLDVKAGMSKREVERELIEKINLYKTSNYTFNLPMVLGYLAAGKIDKKEINTIEKLGNSLGYIFQITDDLIGFTKNEDEIGKDAGSDIRENKKTMIRKLLLKNIKGKDLAFAQSTFGNKNITTSEIKQLRELFITSKVYNQIIEYLEREAVVARNTISRLSVDDKYKNYLSDFVNYLLTRNR